MFFFFAGIPIALRVAYTDRFVRGPFHLGRLSHAVAGAAVLWIAFIAVVFCLPELNPVNSQTLNYAPVAVGVVVAYSFGFWIVSARRWFAGPIRQIIQGKVKDKYSPPRSVFTLTVAGRERRDGHCRHHRSSGDRCRKAGILGREVKKHSSAVRILLLERIVIIPISFSLGPFLVQFCEPNSNEKGKRRSYS